MPWVRKKIIFDPGVEKFSNLKSQPQGQKKNSELRVRKFLFSYFRWGQIIYRN